MHGRGGDEEEEVRLRMGGLACVRGVARTGAVSGSGGDVTHREAPGGVGGWKVWERRGRERMSQ